MYREGPNGDSGGPRAPRGRASHRRRRSPGARAALWLSAPLLVAVVAVLVVACNSTTPTAKRTASTSSSTAPPTTVAAATCPLSGEPAPNGQVPALPALAVKVDNYPDARPQSGLDKADIVFEEPVEGGITRYVAVFQCQQASLVGPVRSARNIDIGILSPFGAPLLVHVGGIDPVIANIDATAIVNEDLGNHGSIIQTVPGRVAPYATYASTQDMWGLDPTNTTPPKPIFTYSNTVPAGTAVTGVAIPFSDTSNVVWQYDPTSKTFLRFYQTQPDMLADNVQNAASNIVVMTVQVTYGPWLENDEGGLEVQAQLANTSGPLEVYRDGVEITGTWSRGDITQPTQLTNSQGQPIALQPGQTWVELVPSTVTVTPTLAPNTTTTAPPPPTTAPKKTTTTTAPKKKS
jgi:Protein of unknown function (DUF3048) N-terminal domain/Protein of unknown function (DUF3048) C-terminal domain